MDLLADTVVESFCDPDPAKRVAKMRETEGDIEFEMFPLISWLERRRSAETSVLVRRRLANVLSEAVACASSDIPEYVGGIVRPHTPGRDFSQGARRTAAMSVTAKMVAASLNDGAEEIESEDASKSRRPKDKRAAKWEAGGNSDRSLKDVFLSPKEWAEREGIAAKAVALEARLRRWRKKNPLNGGFRELANRLPREPQFAYSYAVAKPHIDALKAPRQSPGERRAKPSR